SRDAPREIEQRLVAAGPADERQPDRAAGHRSDRNADLRQAADAGDAGQTHHPYAERFRFLAGNVGSGGDAWSAGQSEDGAGRYFTADMPPRSVMDGARLGGCVGGNRGVERHAFADAGAECRLIRLDEGSVILPDLISLDDADGIA